MIINIKNKYTLIIEDFKLKCCIGRSGSKKNKRESDGSTPKGIFSLGKLYWRPDRLDKPETKLNCKTINKKMGWCTDKTSKNYNKEITVPSKLKHEKLFRKDNKYDGLIVIKYNFIKTVKGLGIAIFIHITKNNKPTAGCIAVSKKDFLILARIIKKNSKILIN